VHSKRTTNVRLRTVGCVEVPVAEAGTFGVMGVDAHGWVEEFQEKPEIPKAVPSRPDIALGSMGIYVFNRDFLFEALIDDASNPSSSHDFGKNLLPRMGREHRVHAHSFRGASSLLARRWHRRPRLPQSSSQHP